MKNMVFFLAILTIMAISSLATAGYSKTAGIRATLTNGSFYYSRCTADTIYTGSSPQSKICTVSTAFPRDNADKYLATMYTSDTTLAENNWWAKYYSGSGWYDDLYEEGYGYYGGGAYYYIGFADTYGYFVFDNTNQYLFATRFTFKNESGIEHFYYFKLPSLN